MRLSKRFLAGLGLSLLAVMFFQSCASLRELVDAVSNLKRLQFKLDRIHGFSIAGIAISRKSSISDFTVMDGVKLLQAFRSKKFRAEFILDILARNPNDGTGGSPRTVSTLTSLECRLLIDDTPTVYGDIDKPFEIPGTGQASVLPLRLGLDLYEFFSNRGYEGLLNLALALGGAGGSTSRIGLDALPKVHTPLGVIVYPNRITIIDKEFR